jgi:hypothetical protein
VKTKEKKRKMKEGKNRNTNRKAKKAAIQFFGQFKEPLWGENRCDRM